MSKEEKYYNYIINDMEKNTHKPYGKMHYYLFDCNVSVNLNHSNYYGNNRPYFSFVPNCVLKIMTSKYGLHLLEAEKLFDIYSEFIIEKYLKDKL